MWRVWLFGFVSSATAESYQAIAFNASCSGAVGCSGYFRTFSPVASNGTFTNQSYTNGTTGGASVACPGFQGPTPVSLSGFKFRNPSDHTETSNSPAFYYAKLTPGSVWDTTTRSASLVGAIAELTSTFNSVSVFYDRDGVEGFQWDVDNASKRYDIFSCTNAPMTYDCIDSSGTINLQSDVIWNALDLRQYPCEAVLPGSGYAPNCTILAMNTRAELPAFRGEQVVVISLRTASQPLIIDGIEVSPDRIVMETVVNYPWAHKTLRDAPNGKILLTWLHAGRGNASMFDGANDTKVLVWNSQQAASYFRYRNTARNYSTIVNSQAQIINSTQIQAFSCSGKPCQLTTTDALMNQLRVYVAFSQVISSVWDVRVTMHSFSGVHPLDLVLNPELGEFSTPRTPAPTSSPPTPPTTPTAAAPSAPTSTTSVGLRVLPVAWSSAVIAFLV